MGKPVDYRERERRVSLANDFIRVIATHGRRFFYNPERSGSDVYGHFYVDINGRLWFADEFAGCKVYIHGPKHQAWKYFTHGGTMRALVEELRDFIMCRKDGLPMGLLGSAGDLWGYGEAAALAVRRECAGLDLNHSNGV